MENKKLHRSEKNVARRRIYNRWRHMLGRCEDRTHPSYDNYGGRGITVCDEWHDFEKYMAWLYEQGYSESNRRSLSVDRIDNDGPYSPENCRLAGTQEQCRNRRCTRWVKDEETGELIPATDYAVLSGRSLTHILNLLKTGKPLPPKLKNLRKTTFAAFHGNVLQRAFSSVHQLKRWWLDQLPKVASCLKGEVDSVMGFGWYYIDDEKGKCKMSPDGLKPAE